MNRKIKVYGMTCSSCEVTVKQLLKEMPGVKKVEVLSNGEFLISGKNVPSNAEIEAVLLNKGYSLEQKGNTLLDYRNMLAFAVIFFGVYVLANRFELFSQFVVGESVSYGFAFMIGLVAAFSTCIAVVGGLLVALTSSYNKLHPNLTSKQKFIPHIYFNIGRIISFTILGGLLGLLGSYLSLSVRVTGFLTIFVAIIMIILGLQLLNLAPWLRYIVPKMPKRIAYVLQSKSKGTYSHSGAFGFGALTFFLPCGFTQALQLYVLSQGSFSVGALTMFAFSLGTLPALVSVGALTSIAKKSFQKYLLTGAGVLVLLVGLLILPGAFSLSGINLTSAQNQPVAELVPMENGKQIVEMEIIGLDYYPSQFTIRAGVPVEWRVDASRAVGCARIVTIPRLNFMEIARDNMNVFEFTPERPGRLEFMCSMAMTTRGAAFTVVESDL